MESSSSNTQAVQITVTQPQMIQGTTSTGPIQIFAQDSSNPGTAGKAFYIIDPTQVAGGLQMISNPERGFDFAGSSATQNLTGSQQQQAQPTVVVR